MTVLVLVTVMVSVAEGHGRSVIVLGVPEGHGRLVIELGVPELPN